MSLKSEITNDPEGYGWAAMTDRQVAAAMNDPTTLDGVGKARTRQRRAMSGDEIFHQTDGAQFQALAADKQQLWLAFCGRDQIDPGAPANIDFVQWVFGGGATVANLAAARREPVNRTGELALGSVSESAVAEARAG